MLRCYELFLLKAVKMMRNDGLTRDEFGKRTDKTGKRDLTFSKWHRKHLGNRFYATDIDFLEYRIENNQFIPKAFLEVKQSHVIQKKYLCSANSRAIFSLAKKAKIKFFIILYELKDSEKLDCEFWVWEPQSESDFDKYDESNFEQFFKKYTNEGLKKMLEDL